MDIVNGIGTWLVSPWWHIAAIALGLIVSWVGYVQVWGRRELKAFISVFGIQPEDDRSDVAMVRTVVIEFLRKVDEETQIWRRLEGEADYLNVPVKDLRERHKRAKEQKTKRSVAMAAYREAVVLALIFGYQDTLLFAKVIPDDVPGFWRRRSYRKVYQPSIVD